MHLLVSVLAENWLQVRRALLSGGRPPPGAVGSRTALPAAVLDGLAGRLLLIDWDAGRITHHWPLPSPACVSWEPGEPQLWVASGRGGTLSCLDSRTWRTAAVHSHPGFHDLHSVTRHGAHLLVTAAGTDAVFELDLHGRITRSWWATEHGLERTPAGERRSLDPDADHRGAAYPSLGRAVHPNGAVALPDGRWRVTSFHLGAVLDVTTGGRWTVWAEGFDHPHGLRRLPHGAVPGAAWLLCDTLRGEVLALGEDGDRVAVLASGLRWVQDACWTQAGLVVLDDLHVRPGERPGRGNTVLRPGSGRHCELPASWRLVSVLTLTADQAAACQSWPALPEDAVQRWSEGSRG